LSDNLLKNKSGGEMKNLKRIVRLVKATTLLFILLVVGKAGYSQGSVFENEMYGFGFSLESSRLLNDRMFVEGNYTLGRRTFEIGISTGSYRSDEQGFLFRHKIFLNRKANKDESFNLSNHKFKTYVMYKFVMFTSGTSALRKDFDVIESETIFENSFAAPTLNTIEHYIGLGMELDLFNNFSIDVMGGAGINFIRDNSNIIITEDRMLSQAGTDLSWDLSLGINYRF